MQSLATSTNSILIHKVYQGLTGKREKETFTLGQIRKEKYKRRSQLPLSRWHGGRHSVRLLPHTLHFQRPFEQPQWRHDCLLGSYHSLSKPQREAPSPDLVPGLPPNVKRLFNEAGRQATRAQPEHLIPHKGRIKVTEDRVSIIQSTESRQSGEALRHGETKYLNNTVDFPKLSHS